MLSDGIADLLYTGSNRLETRTEMNQIGLYLLRADQDLIDKFLPSTSQTNARRSSISENETEYFIVNQDMICRVLHDHKLIRKIESINSSSPSRCKSSSAPSPSPSNHQRFFSQSLFNETIKNNT